MRAWVIVLTGCGRIAFDARGDAGDAGAGSDSDVVQSVPCNSISTVRDTFPGADYDHDLWGYTYQDIGTSITVAGGEALLQPASGMSQRYAGLVTYRHYDLHDARVVLDAAQVGPGGTTSGMQLKYGTNLLILTAGAGSLIAAYRDPAYHMVSMMTYSAATQRYWAIGEHSGTITWETSADGVTFVPVAQVAAPFDISHVRIDVFAGTETPQTAPGPFHVASVGTAGAPPRQACTADMLVDTFDDLGTLDRDWVNSTSSMAGCCSYTFAGGQLRFSLDGTTGFANLRSSSGFDLRGRDVHVELVQPAVQAGINQALVVKRDEQNKVELVFHGTTFDTYEVVANVGFSHNTAALAGERYLRIREAGGNYLSEVSTDRLTWRTLRMAPIPFPFDDITFDLEVGNYNAPIGADTVIWDNFNAP